MEYKKSIIIGRKGSGKTAIYKFLAEEKGNHFSPLLFNDYPWKLHDKFKNNIVSERESYISSWTFYFYIEIFKRIFAVKKEITDKKTLKELNKLEKWVKKNWGSSEFDHKEVMSPNKKSLKFTFNPQIMGNSLGSISRDLQAEDNLSGTLSEYNRKFKNILKELALHLPNDIFIAFDELDLAYDSNEKNYKDRLIGLLLTAYKFYQQYPNRIRIFVFLRSDIFNILVFQDKNKIKDNMVEFLDWESNSTSSKLSLKKFVSNRIKANIQSDSDNFERNWSEIFDDNNIGKNQLKWNFIIERTFMRPRDIIKFLNLSLGKAQERLQSNTDTIDKITNEDIHDIRSKYSSYLFEELKDEISSNYPEYNKYLDILRNIHKVIFTREEFLKSYDVINQRDSIDVDPDTLLLRFYEFSIIGFYKPGGGGYGGSEYRFQYNSDVQPFNTNASNFKVHFGFKEYLELLR